VPRWAREGGGQEARGREAGEPLGCTVRRERWRAAGVKAVARVRVNVGGDGEGGGAGGWERGRCLTKRKGD
jgi:hypothetical protein